MSRGGRGPEAIRSSGFNSSARVNAVVITVLIGSSEPGVWVIKTAQTIPNSELWLHQPAASNRLERALLAMSEPPSAADLDALGANPSQYVPALGIDPQPPRGKWSTALLDAQLSLRFELASVVIWNR